MSREQWGHGYWKGVKDAKSGKVDEDLKELVTLLILHLRADRRGYAGPEGSELLVPVKYMRSYIFFNVMGCHDNTWEQVYDYIAAENPHECYITGSPFNKKEDDFIFLNPHGIERLLKYERPDLMEEWEDVL